MEKAFKAWFAVLILCAAAVLVACGNPVKGKSFSYELFGQEVSVMEFNKNGTYVVSTALSDDTAEGKWVYKDGRVITDENTENETVWFWDSKAETLTSVNSILAVVYKLKK